MRSRQTFTSLALGLGALLAALTAPVLASQPTLQSCAGDFARLLQPVAAASAAMDARAVWLDRRLIRWPQAERPAPSERFKLAYSARGQIDAEPGRPVAGADGMLDLERFDGHLPAALAERFKWVGAGPTLALRTADLPRLPTLLRGQLVLVQADAAGLVRRATARAAGRRPGRSLRRGRPARRSGRRCPPAPARASSSGRPPRRRVWLCLHPSGTAPAARLAPMVFDDATGAWDAELPRDLSGGYYTYLVDVFVPGVGLVRNRVTDPYSLSLSTDSRRSWIGRLADPALRPAGWATAPRPQEPVANTDLVIYELHLRDFSASDATVRPAWRGKYLAFTEAGSDGMRHLRALAAAGVTDVHLLPVFDFATVPEQGCVTPEPSGGPASESQQATVTAHAAEDCFNWGYDPYHFAAPEGSYATDAADGAMRVVEFRRMVQALHAAGLRVGMDMVFNHTAAAGQAAHSVLDRIVPGYYQRLDAKGQVATSTCCANTATENLMMGKLMVDAAVRLGARLRHRQLPLRPHGPPAARGDGAAAAGGRRRQRAPRPAHRRGLEFRRDRRRRTLRAGRAGAARRQRHRDLQRPRPRRLARRRLLRRCRCDAAAAGLDQRPALRPQRRRAGRARGHARRAAAQRRPGSGRVGRHAARLPAAHFRRPREDARRRSTMPATPPATRASRARSSTTSRTTTTRPCSTSTRSSCRRRPAAKTAPGSSCWAWR